MSIVGLDAPNFRTVSDFRKRHLEALSGLFVQVLRLCETAGLYTAMKKAQREPAFAAHPADAMS